MALLLRFLIAFANVFVFRTILLCLGDTSSVDLKALKPFEVALLQFDSRKPDDYWLVSALWNKQYCDRHGHVFIYYASRDGCHHDGERLAAPWCKVRSMINANLEYPSVQFFIYMDSDAVVDVKFRDAPLNT